MAQPKKGYVMEKGAIVLQRSLTELDMFVKDFLDVLEKHSHYLVVSGYVSICSGRTRGTEDVDILVPPLPNEKFKLLFYELKKSGFWCYQGDEASSVYDYFKALVSVRFARKDELFPNIELIPLNETRKAQSFEFMHPQKIKINGFEFNIPPIEFEILYKEIILKGKKDMEDARHLRAFFSDILQKERFVEYEPIIQGETK